LIDQQGRYTELLKTQLYEWIGWVDFATIMIFKS
jgi:hypothetical protein